jgi:hypothetical protein
MGRRYRRSALSASRGLQKDAPVFKMPPMIYLRTLCLAFLILFLESCSVTEQAPEEVSQKFQEGIKGNGTIVPEDKDHSQTGVSNNSPVTKPAAAPQP